MTITGIWKNEVQMKVKLKLKVTHLLGVATQCCFLKSLSVGHAFLFGAYEIFSNTYLGPMKYSGIVICITFPLLFELSDKRDLSPTVTSLIELG